MGITNKNTQQRSPIADSNKSGYSKKDSQPYNSQIKKNATPSQNPFAPNRKSENSIEKPVNQISENHERISESEINIIKEGVYESPYHPKMKMHIFKCTGLPIAIALILLSGIMIAMLYLSMNVELHNIKNININFLTDRVEAVNHLSAKYINSKFSDPLTRFLYTSEVLKNLTQEGQASNIPDNQFGCAYIKDHLKKSSTIFDANGIVNQPACGSETACKNAGTANYTAAADSAILAQKVAIELTIAEDYVYPSCWWTYGLFGAKHYLDYQATLATDSDFLSDYYYMMNATLIPNVYNKNMANSAIASATIFANMNAKIASFYSVSYLSDSNQEITNITTSHSALYTIYEEEPTVLFGLSNVGNYFENTYQNCATAGYDGRCRPFYENIKAYMTQYHSDHGNYNNFEDTFPIITSDIYNDASSGIATATFCHPVMKTDNSALYSATCLDYEIGLIKPILINTYNLIKNGNDTVNNTDYGYFLMKLDKNGKYQSLVMTSWTDDETSTMTQNLDNYPHIKHWVEKYSADSNFNINSTIEYNWEDGNDNTQVTITTLELTAHYHNSALNKTVGYLILGMTYKSGWYYWQIDQIYNEGVIVIIIYLVILIVLCLVLIVIEICLSQKQSEYISRSLDLLLYLLVQVESKNETKRCKEIKDRPEEVYQLYFSYLRTRNVITGAFQAKETGNETEALLKYSLAYKLFNHVNNYRAAGIIQNNMGNINYNIDRNEECIRNYEMAIELFEKHYLDYLSETVNEQDLKQIRIKRKLNLVNGIIKKYERDKEAGKPDSEILPSIDILEKNLWDLSKYCKSVPREDLENKIYTKLVWINTTIKKKQLAKARDCLKTAKYNYDTAISNPIIGTNMAADLWQEIVIEEAKILIQEQKHGQAASILTNALRLGNRVYQPNREKILNLLKNIFEHNDMEITPGLQELLDRLERRHNVKEYVIALDYSRSMGFGNRIESAIACILKFWDEYAQSFDKIAFLRYNQNVETTFHLEKKEINAFSKRCSIEDSVNPKERTCLYDVIAYGYKMLQKSNLKKVNKYCIVFSDGADTASTKTLAEIIEIVEGDSMICLIGIGLGLSQEEAEVFGNICLKSNGGRYLDYDYYAIVKIFDIISGYASFKGQNDQYEEDL